MQKPSDCGLWSRAATLSWKPVLLIRVTESCSRPRCLRVCRLRPIAINIFRGPTDASIMGMSSSQAHRACHAAMRVLPRLCLLLALESVLWSAKLPFCRDR